MRKNFAPISPDGEVLHWNQATETIFGFPREEALSLPRALNGLVAAKRKDCSPAHRVNKR